MIPINTTVGGGIGSVNGGKILATVESGQSIKTGDFVGIKTYITPQINVGQLSGLSNVCAPMTTANVSDDTFVCCYRINGVAGGYAVVGKVGDNGGVTFGTPVLVESNTAFDGIHIVPMDSSTVVIRYTSQLNFYRSLLRALTISGTTITVGASIEIVKDPSNPVKLTSSKLLVSRAYSSSTIYCGVITLSGTTLTAQTEHSVYFSGADSWILHPVTESIVSIFGVRSYDSSYSLYVSFVEVSSANVVTAWPSSGSTLLWPGSGGSTTFIADATKLKGNRVCALGILYSNSYCRFWMVEVNVETKTIKVVPSSDFGQGLGYQYNNPGGRIRSDNVNKVMHMNPGNTGITVALSNVSGHGFAIPTPTVVIGDGTAWYPSPPMLMKGRWYVVYSTGGTGAGYIRAASITTNYYVSKYDVFAHLDTGIAGSSGSQGSTISVITSISS